MTRRKSVEAAERPAASIQDLEPLVGFELRRTYFASARKFAEFLSELSIKSGQYSILLAIEKAPDQTQSAIAKLLSVDRSTMVPLLDQLERKGLVSRTRRTDDRRSHALKLTEKGAWAVRESRRFVDAHEAMLTAGLSPTERQQLLDLLRRLRRNCELDGS